MDIEMQKSCRICQDTGNEEFISPCNCSGSMKFVHVACHEKWIRVSKNSNTCPTCNTYYHENVDIDINTELMVFLIGFVIGICITCCYNSNP